MASGEFQLPQQVKQEQEDQRPDKLPDFYMPKNKVTTKIAIG
jgi:hypothetical protein